VSWLRLLGDSRRPADCWEVQVACLTNGLKPTKVSPGSSLAITHLLRRSASRRDMPPPWQNRCVNARPDLFE
jgi:hypothetical protein